MMSPRICFTPCATTWSARSASALSAGPERSPFLANGNTRLDRLASPRPTSTRSPRNRPLRVERSQSFQCVVRVRNSRPSVDSAIDRGEQLHVRGGLEIAIRIQRIERLARFRIHDQHAPVGLLRAVGREGRFRALTKTRHVAPLGGFAALPPANRLGLLRQQARRKKHHQRQQSAPTQLARAGCPWIGWACGHSCTNYRPTRPSSRTSTFASSPHQS